MKVTISSVDLEQMTNIIRSSDEASEARHKSLEQEQARLADIVENGLRRQEHLLLDLRRDHMSCHPSVLSVTSQRSHPCSRGGSPTPSPRGSPPVSRRVSTAAGAHTSIQMPPSSSRPRPATGGQGCVVS